ncbi:MAG: reverse transcriptase family protein [Candidatus Thiodiazotropha taylori]|nr:reverse transcriptase family protein [Candidatus Thiodiazotropha taylori]
MSDELLTIFGRNDIILFTETWTSEFADISVNGFNEVRLDRVTKKQTTKRNSGGIAIYIKSTIYKHVKVVKRESDDIIWLRINGYIFNLAHDVYLCLCYIVPSGSSREALIDIQVLDRLSDFILNIANETDNGYNLIVCGDFNSRTGTGEDYVLFDNDRHMQVLPDGYISDTEMIRSSEDKITNANGKKLLEFCIQNSLRICNGRLGMDKDIGKFTYIGTSGCSVVDYVLVNPTLLHYIYDFEVGEPNILSDHCAVQFSVKCNDVIVDTQAFDMSRQENRIYKKYLWNTNHRHDYIDALNYEREAFSNLTTLILNSRTSGEIDFGIDLFLQLMAKICDPFFSKEVHRAKSGRDKRAGRRSTKWFDKECELCRDRFYRHLNIFRTAKSDDSRLEMVQSRSDYKSTIRKKKYEYEKCKTDRLVQCKASHPKEYWKLLKQAANSIDNINITSEQFEEYFRTLSDPGDPFYAADADIIEYNEQYERGDFQIIFDELNEPIELGEVQTAIKELRNGASAGPDLLLNEFLKHGSEILVAFIHRLFNHIFDLGYFPEAWSEGFIVPIHKKGDRNDVSNYRGITLLSILGKLFTRVLNNRLTTWAETYSIYVEAQAGFRKHMGTVDNIFVLSSLIKHFLNNNQFLFCAFIDFSKAFDYVVRDVVWYKLLKIGVRGKMLDIIKSIYQNVKSKVKHNNKLSSSFTCNIGVRQGECLSPFLFSMCVNDLEEELMINGVNGIVIGLFQLFLLLYADDIILMASTATDLQNALDTLANYCHRWKMVVNNVKTKIVIFRKGGRLPNNTIFTYNGVEIEIVSQFSYLGILFTSGGSFIMTQKILAGQALKAIFTLNRYLYKFIALSVSHVLDLFDRLITPILNYSCEVWGFQKSRDIETVHLQFFKRLLGVKQSTQNDFIYGELGRTDFQTKRYTIIIKYWLKVIECDPRKLVKKVYDIMLSDLETSPNKLNWAASVKHLLSSLGFLDVWLAQGVGDTEFFLITFKRRTKDIFMQNWHSRIEESSRARFYITFANFEFQKYLDCLKIAKFRKSFCRYRVSAHRLEVEAGRWTKPNKTPLENRKCRICNVLEDEYHFLFECVLYQELRKQYIGRYYWQRPSMIKLVELVSSKNENILKKLSTYLNKAFKTRNEQLYS